MSKLVKVKIIRSTVANGERVQQGKTIDVNLSDARYLVVTNRAVNVEDEPKVEKPVDKAEKAKSKGSEKR